LLIIWQEQKIGEVSEAAIVAQTDDILFDYYTVAESAVTIPWLVAEHVTSRSKISEGENNSK
jgi:hypothetical protein